MKQCNNFLIIANETKDIDLVYSRRTVEGIEKRGGNAELIVGTSSDKIRSSAEAADAVIVLGGDGTILRVSHALDGCDTPVIGVNLGTVGFMAEVIVSEIDSMLDKLMAGDYSIEDRMMLEGKVNGETTQALNDIVLAREDALRIIAVRIYVNDEFFDTTEADGIILSTPTGSTGYNLSAGGPIVKSDARLILMTPISPYSMSRRSIVFGADDRITLELVEKRKDIINTALVAFDGAESFGMMVGDKVEVSVSRNIFRIIRLEHVSVYETIRRKIGG